MRTRGKRCGNRISVLLTALALLAVTAAGGAAAPKAAVALEQRPRCGAEEHVHTAECYLGDVLACGRKAHTHSKSCYPVLLEDNDINALLTRVDETADKSLETAIAGAEAAGEAGQAAGQAGQAPEGALSAGLVLNEGLRSLDTTAGAMPSDTYPVETGAPSTASAGDSPVGTPDSGERAALNVPDETAPAETKPGSAGDGGTAGQTGAGADTPEAANTSQTANTGGTANTANTAGTSGAADTSGTSGTASGSGTTASRAPRASGSLTVRYTVNWSTPRETNAPAALPTLAGSNNIAVGEGESLTVSRVSQRVVSCAFRIGYTRYGAVYFTGWRTETGELLQPSSQIGYDELASYDGDGDGVVDLTGVWRYHQLQSVNFFVKYNSKDAHLDIDKEYYTDVIFSTFAGGIDSEVSRGVSYLNNTYAVNLDRSNDYLTYDKEVRKLYGGSTGPWLADFPEDAYIFEELKKYAVNGQLSVPNDEGESELVNVEDLSEEGYAIRWYIFFITNDGGYSDWHIDGALIRKEGKAHVAKTFAGNETLISASREKFYIHAANDDGKKQYILTTDAVSDSRKAEILAELGLAAAQIKAWITPMDDGDGDSHTLLWEFGDLDYNEEWTVTEHPPDLPDTMSYAEWTLADASALNQSASGTGTAVTFRGVTQATDVEDPEWLRVSFNNIYYRADSLMLKKEDAATGHALAGAAFQFYQNERLMSFDLDPETGLYVYNQDDAGAVTTLVCNGYTNVSTTGFSYDVGDITIREVASPEGYNRVGDVTLGYLADGTVGITSDSGAYARYENGLLIIENSSDPINVAVVKEWNCADSERADVTVQLLANGSANLAAAALQDSGQSVTVTLTEVNGWTHTWTALPVYASGGPVTWSVRETRIGGENCKADYTFPNWIASYRSRVTHEGLVLTVRNTPKRPMLYLEKRDFTGKKLLEGASFALVAVDGNGDPLPGAVTKTGVTGADGALSFDNLRYNTRYRLTETAAPADYLPFTEPAYLTIAESGTVEVEAHGYVSSAGTAYHIRALNRGAYSLPESGGPGTLPFHAPGGLLAAAALWGLARVRRKGKRAERRP